MGLKKPIGGRNIGPPWPNGRTVTPPNATQTIMAPLVRVNGQAFDPTTTSVVTSSEGFWQRSGEN